MNIFESWDEFGIFSVAITRSNRYVLDARSRRFIEVLVQTTEKRKHVISKDAILWRAQVAHEFRTVYQRNHSTEGDAIVTDDEWVPAFEVPTACQKERLIPWRHKAKEGRINPKGIPCLYAAEDKETAMGEMRPWIGSLITAATFKTVRECCVVDCTRDYEFGCQYERGEEPAPDAREKAVWSAINEAFSMPITDSDHTADYAPTQVLAEVFRSNGYGGVRFKSSLGAGFNLALFDPDSAIYVGGQLYKVNNVKYEFVNEEFDVPGFV